jgi:hypothetical protein
MKTPTKRVLLLFVLSVGSLVGWLFYPLYHHSQQGQRLTHLTNTLQEKEKNYAQRVALQETYARNAERIAGMERQGFFEGVDAVMLVHTIQPLAQNNKIQVRDIQIAQPVKDPVEGSWSIIHWPVQVEFSGSSEEDVYRTIESLQEDLPGRVIPKELVIIQKKRYAFWGRFGFEVVVGQSIREYNTKFPFENVR